MNLFQEYPIKRFIMSFSDGDGTDSTGGLSTEAAEAQTEAALADAPPSGPASDDPYSGWTSTGYSGEQGVGPDGEGGYVAGLQAAREAAAEAARQAQEAATKAAEKAAKEANDKASEEAYARLASEARSKEDQRAEAARAERMQEASKYEAGTRELLAAQEKESKVVMIPGAYTKSMEKGLSHLVTYEPPAPKGVGSPPTEAYIEGKHTLAEVKAALAEGKDVSNMKAGLSANDLYELHAINAAGVVTESGKNDFGLPTGVAFPNFAMGNPTPSATTVNYLGEVVREGALEALTPTGAYTTDPSVEGKGGSASRLQDYYRNTMNSSQYKALSPGSWWGEPDERTAKFFADNPWVTPYIYQIMTGTYIETEEVAAKLLASGDAWLPTKTQVMTAALKGISFDRIDEITNKLDANGIFGNQKIGYNPNLLFGLFQDIVVYDNNNIPRDAMFTRFAGRFNYLLGAESILRPNQLRDAQVNLVKEASQASDKYGAINQMYLGPLQRGSQLGFDKYQWVGNILRPSSEVKDGKWVGKNITATKSELSIAKPYYLSAEQIKVPEAQILRPIISLPPADLWNPVAQEYEMDWSVPGNVYKGKDGMGNPLTITRVKDTVVAESTLKGNEGKDYSELTINVKDGTAKLRDFVDGKATTINIDVLKHSDGAYSTCGANGGQCFTIIPGEQLKEIVEQFNVPTKIDNTPGLPPLYIPKDDPIAEWLKLWTPIAYGLEPGAVTISPIVAGSKINYSGSVLSDGRIVVISELPSKGFSKSGQNWQYIIADPSNGKYTVSVIEGNRPTINEVLADKDPVWKNEDIKSNIGISGTCFGGDQACTGDAAQIAQDLIKQTTGILPVPKVSTNLDIESKPEVKIAPNTIQGVEIAPNIFEYEGKNIIRKAENGWVVQILMSKEESARAGGIYGKSWEQSKVFTTKQEAEAYLIGIAAVTPVTPKPDVTPTPSSEATISKIKPQELTVSSVKPVIPTISEIKPPEVTPPAVSKILGPVIPPGIGLDTVTGLPIQKQKTGFEAVLTLDESEISKVKPEPSLPTSIPSAKVIEIQSVKDLRDTIDKVGGVGTYVTVAAAGVDLKWKGGKVVDVNLEDKDHVARLNAINEAEKYLENVTPSGKLNDIATSGLKGLWDSGYTIYTNPLKMNDDVWIFRPDGKLLTSIPDIGLVNINKLSAEFETTKNQYDKDALGYTKALNGIEMKWSPYIKTTYDSSGRDNVIKEWVGTDVQYDEYLEDISVVESKQKSLEPIGQKLNNQYEILSLSGAKLESKDPISQMAEYAKADPGKFVVGFVPGIGTAVLWNDMAVSGQVVSAGQVISIATDALSLVGAGILGKAMIKAGVAPWKIVRDVLFDATILPRSLNPKTDIPFQKLPKSFMSDLTEVLANPANVESILKYGKPEEQIAKLKSMLNHESQKIFDAVHEIVSEFGDYKAPSSQIAKVADFSLVKSIPVEAAKPLHDYIQSISKIAEVRGSFADKLQMEGVKNVPVPNDIDLKLNKNAGKTKQQVANEIVSRVNKSVGRNIAKVVQSNKVAFLQSGGKFEKAIDVAYVGTFPLSEHPAPLGFKATRELVTIDGIKFEPVGNQLWHRGKELLWPASGKSYGLIGPEARVAGGDIEAGRRTKDVSRFVFLAQTISENLIKQGKVSEAQKILDNINTIVNGPTGKPMKIPVAKTGVQVIAVGDTHGDINRLKEILVDKGVVGDKGEWAGGNKKLILTGDLTDKGPNDMGTIRQVRRLQEEAQKSGGGITVLLGNHDARLVSVARILQKSPDMRNLSSAELRIINDYKKNGGNIGIAQIISKQKSLVDWFSNLPLIHKEGNDLFLHVDSMKFYKNLGNSVDEINKNANRMMQTVDGSYNLSRRMILDSGDLTERNVDAMLKSYGVSRIIHGHKAVDAIVTKYGGKLVDIDAKLSSGYSKDPNRGKAFMVSGEKSVVDSKEFLKLFQELQKASLVESRSMSIIHPTQGALTSTSTPAKQILGRVLYTGVRDIRPYKKALENGEVIVGKILNDAGEWVDAPNEKIFTSDKAAFDRMYDLENGVIGEHAGIVAIRTVDTDVGVAINPAFRFEKIEEFKGVKGKILGKEFQKGKTEEFRIIFDEWTIEPGQKLFPTVQSDIKIKNPVAGGLTGETLTRNPRTGDKVPMLWLTTEKAKQVGVDYAEAPVGMPTRQQVNAMNRLALKASLIDLLHPHLQKDIRFTTEKGVIGKSNLINFYQDNLKFIETSAEKEKLNKQLQSIINRKELNMTKQQMAKEIADAYGFDLPEVVNSKNFKDLDVDASFNYIDGEVTLRDSVTAKGNKGINDIVHELVHKELIPKINRVNRGEIKGLDSSFVKNTEDFTGQRKYIENADNNFNGALLKDRNVINAFDEIVDTLYIQKLTGHLDKVYLDSWVKVFEPNRQARVLEISQKYIDSLNIPRKQDLSVTLSKLEKISKDNLGKIVTKAELDKTLTPIKAKFGELQTKIDEALVGDLKDELQLAHKEAEISVSENRKLLQEHYDFLMGKKGLGVGEMTDLRSVAEQLGLSIKNAPPLISKPILMGEIPTIEIRKINTIKGDNYEVIPKLKRGYVRVQHETNPKSAEIIKSRGLSYYNGIDSTTDQLPGSIKGLSKRISDNYGEKTLIFDIPKTEYEKHLGKIKSTEAERGIPDILPDRESGLEVGLEGVVPNKYLVAEISTKRNMIPVIIKDGGLYNPKTNKLINVEDLPTDLLDDYKYWVDNIEEFEGSGGFLRGNLKVEGVSTYAPTQAKGKLYHKSSATDINKLAEAEMRMPQLEDFIDEDLPISKEALAYEFKYIDKDIKSSKKELSKLKSTNENYAFLKEYYESNIKDLNKRKMEIVEELKTAKTERELEVALGYEDFDNDISERIDLGEPDISMSTVKEEYGFKLNKGDWGYEVVGSNGRNIFEVGVDVHTNRNEIILNGMISGDKTGKAFKMVMQEILDISWRDKKVITAQIVNPTITRVVTMMDKLGLLKVTLPKKSGDSTIIRVLKDPKTFDEARRVRTESQKLFHRTPNNVGTMIGASKSSLKASASDINKLADDILDKKVTAETKQIEDLINSSPELRNTISSNAKKLSDGYVVNLRTLAENIGKGAIPQIVGAISITKPLSATELPSAISEVPKVVTKIATTIPSPILSIPAIPVIETVSSVPSTKGIATVISTPIGPITPPTTPTISTIPTVPTMPTTPTIPTTPTTPTTPIISPVTPKIPKVPPPIPPKPPKFSLKLNKNRFEYYSKNSLPIGSLAWKQGAIYRHWFPPYRKAKEFPQDWFFSRKPIPGVPYAEGVGSAYASIVKLGGTEIPDELHYEMGLQKLTIKKKAGSDEPAIFFELDRNDASWSPENKAERAAKEATEEKPKTIEVEGQKYVAVESKKSVRKAVIEPVVKQEEIQPIVATTEAVEQPITEVRQPVVEQQPIVEIQQPIIETPRPIVSEQPKQIKTEVVEEVDLFDAPKGAFELNDMDAPKDAFEVSSINDMGKDAFEVGDVYNQGGSFDVYSEEEPKNVIPQWREESTVQLVNRKPVQSAQKKSRLNESIRLIR